MPILLLFAKLPLLIKPLDDVCRQSGFTGAFYPLPERKNFLPQQGRGELTGLKPLDLTSLNLEKFGLRDFQTDIFRASLAQQDAAENAAYPAMGNDN